MGQLNTNEYVGHVKLLCLTSPMKESIISVMFTWGLGLNQSGDYRHIRHWLLPTCDALPPTTPNILAYILSPDKYKHPLEVPDPRVVQDQDDDLSYLCSISEMFTMAGTRSEVVWSLDDCAWTGGKCFPASPSYSYDHHHHTHSLSIKYIAGN